MAMDTLEINKNEYTPKLSFRALKELKEHKYQNMVGMDGVVSALIDQDPETIVSIYHASLADYKMKQPTEEQVFDAVSELFNVSTSANPIEEQIDKIFGAFKDSGFFKVQLKAWVNNQKKYLKMLDAKSYAMKQQIQDESDKTLKAELQDKFQTQSEVVGNLKEQVSKLDKLISRKA